MDDLSQLSLDELVAQRDKYARVHGSTVEEITRRHGALDRDAEGGPVPAPGCLSVNALVMLAAHFGEKLGSLTAEIRRRAGAA